MFSVLKCLKFLLQRYFSSLLKIDRICCFANLVVLVTPQTITIIVIDHSYGITNIFYLSTLYVVLCTV